MELIGCIYHIEESTWMQDNCEAYLVEVPFFTANPQSVLALEEIQKLADRKKVFLKMDRLFTEKELQQMQEELLPYLKLDVFYYISDLALAVLLKKHHLIDRTIYDPQTMITNSLDAVAYEEYGFHGISISNEILLKDAVKIAQTLSCKSFYQVFGYRKMMVSKRPLLSFYQEKYQLSFAKKGYLQEETRKNFYPVEEQKETYLYNSDLLSFHKELYQLPMDYVFIERYRLDRKFYSEVLHLFQQAKTSPITEVSYPYANPFAEQDTVYQKEALEKNEI